MEYSFPGLLLDQEHGTEQLHVVINLYCIVTIILRLLAAVLNLPLSTHFLTSDPSINPFYCLDMFELSFLLLLRTPDTGLILYPTL
jgi:hypothetical protein